MAGRGKSGFSLKTNAYRNSCSNFVVLVRSNRGHLGVDRRLGSGRAGAAAAQEGSRQVSQAAAAASAADEGVDQEGSVLKGHLHDGVDGRFALSLDSLKKKKEAIFWGVSVQIPARRVNQ